MSFLSYGTENCSIIPNVVVFEEMCAWNMQISVEVIHGVGQGSETCGSLGEETEMIEEIMGWERSFLISIRFFKLCDFWLIDNKLKCQLKFQGCTSFTFASLFATLATQATHLPSIFHHKVENKAHMRYFSSISHQSSTIKIIINYLTQ